MNRTHRPLKRTLCTLTLLALLAVALPTATRGQEPQPGAEADRFLEARIHEPGHFHQHPTLMPDSSVASQGLHHWQIETVDSAGGSDLSLALDAANRPHISYGYHDPTNHDLKYVYYDGTAWQIQTVDTAGNVGGYTSLAMDATGHPHISYYDGTNDALKYAYHDGYVWQIETVDSAGWVGKYSSLALDANDRPHISYWDYTDYDLKYAYHDGTNWYIETVDSAGDVGCYTSLALDSADRPHISYYDSTNQDLKYAHHDGSAWQIETVEGAGTMCRSTSLRLDIAGRPHVSYCDQTYNLRYAYYDGSVWQMQTVVDVGFMRGWGISLALDAASLPHISYCVHDQYFGSNDLKYAYYDGSAWQIETAIEHSDGGPLAVDTLGQPHIAYSSYAGLEYAVRLTDPTDWSRLTFASYRDMNWEVYTAQGDGTSPFRRTNNTAVDYTPEFNQGATRIAFVSTRDGNTEIYTMNADGSNQTRLTWNSASDYLPTWSPDGPKIAFYSDRDGNAEIYVMNADGSSQTRLTSNSAWDGHPTWSPDGAKIAFVSNRSGQYELWTMDADGSNQQQLTSGLSTAAYPDWSPDGSRIAFSDDANGDGWFDLAVTNADGTGLIHPLGYSPSPYDYMAPAWDPTGMYLAFAKVQWTYYQGNWYWVDAYINYMLNLDSNSVYALVDSGYDWWPDWQSADISAPSSRVTAPAWSSVPTFTVQWSGTDIGPAGLRSYDVQYRDGPDGTWTDWLLDTIQTAATFTGEYGHTYYFRCRARDHVGNLEAYPGGDGDTSTRIYRYALSGYVLGNRDQPVAVSTVQATPSALNTARSGANGDFTLYFDQAGIYVLEASRDGFGALPPMTGIFVTEPPTLTFCLPPADDHIIDGGFEAGDLVAWHSSGDVIPVLTTTAHTGDSAISLGGMVPPPIVTPTVPFTVSTVITEAGGLLDSSQVHVQVPSGTVSGTSVFTLTGVPSVADLPTVTQDLGLHFNLTAALSDSHAITGTLVFTGSRPLTTTLRPVTITVTYEDAVWDAAQVAGEETLSLWRYDVAGMMWLPLSGTLDTLSNSLTAATEHLGLFALLGVPAESWSSILEQGVVLSPTLTSGTLSLLYRVAAAELTSDTLRIHLIGPTRTVTHSLPLTPSGWVHQWWDVSAWVGSPLTVRVEWAQGERERLGGVILDEISLGAAVVGSYPVYMPIVLRSAQ